MEKRLSAENFIDPETREMNAVLLCDVCAANPE
jgi:hypothetical protein